MEEKHINMIEPVEDSAFKKREKMMYYKCVDCGCICPIKEEKLDEWKQKYNTYPCHCPNCKKLRANKSFVTKVENN